MSPEILLPTHSSPKQHPHSFKPRRIFLALLSLSAFVAFLLWRQAVYDATVLRYNKSVAQMEEAQLHIEEEPETPLKDALTSLGLEADQSYKLGSINPQYYQASLEGFIDAAFPKSLKSTLKKQLSRYLTITSPQKLPKRPQTIWQTNDVYPINSKTQSWDRLNKGHRIRFMNDEDADEWVRKIFKGSAIEWTWDHLPHIVMKADFLRYLFMLVEGGVYSDIDTTCLKPISHWGNDPDVKGDIRGGSEPAAIIGVEADVGNRADWHKWWSRPVQLVQWTMAFSPGHPIVLDTIRRIHLKTKQADEILGGSLQAIPDDYIADSVLEWTGPAVFTDAAFRFLQVENGIQWPDLKSLRKPLRVGSVTILPVTGFSPGVGNFGAQGTDDGQAMVHHDFGGSWKPKKHSKKSNTTS